MRMINGRCSKLKLQRLDPHFYLSISATFSRASSSFPLSSRVYESLGQFAVDARTIQRHTIMLSEIARIDALPRRSASYERSRIVFEPWLARAIARDASFTTIYACLHTYVPRYKVASNAAIIARSLQLTVNSFSGTVLNRSRQQLEIFCSVRFIGVARRWLHYFFGVCLPQLLLLRCKRSEQLHSFGVFDLIRF